MELFPIEQLEKAILKNMYYGSLFVLNFDFSNIKPSEIKGPGIDLNLEERWYYSANHYRLAIRGHTYWYKDFYLNRNDGPAIEYADGGKEWRRNGQLHREDGPAIEFADGRKSWFKNGSKYTEKEHKKLKEKYDTIKAARKSYS